MFKSKLTVITAVYNGAEYIEETIESVLKNCSGIDFEYIVLNDGSTDKTLEILNKYEKVIRIINKSNSGESDSVSLGFKEATGDLLLVVSADDPLLSEKLFLNVFEAFEKDANLMAIYPDWQMIDANGRVIKTIYVPSYSDELLIGRCVTLPGPGVIFRKSAALKLNGRNPKWTFVGDYDFWLRLSRLGELRHRPEVLAQWRHHVHSTSVSKRGLKMAKERIEVVESFIAANTISDQLKQMALGNAYYMAARLSYFDNKIPSKMYLIKAFKFRRGWVEEAKLHEILYIFLLPYSSFFNPVFDYILRTFGRSTDGS
jgi:glycosyltransferase involved in cell wall biosynthesis